MHNQKVGKASLGWFTGALPEARSTTVFIRATQAPTCWTALKHLWIFKKSIILRKMLLLAPCLIP